MADDQKTTDPMVYCVDRNGMWWPAYERPHAPFARWATPEEHSLMEKVVWHTDTAADVKHLLELLGEFNG